MIKHLTQDQINRDKWDNCIRNAPNELIYAYSWYLDVVSPAWEALIINDYKAVFPLPVKRKFGIKYLAQPLFTQQLGWFGDIGLVDFSTIKLLKRKYIFGFLSLNKHNPEETYTHHKKRINLVLSLNHSLKEIESSFSSHHRRNLKKAANNNLSIEETDLESFGSFHKESSWNKKYGLKDKHLGILLRLVEESIKRRAGKVFAVKDIESNIVSLSFVTNSRSRITYLFPVTNKKGYELNAQYYLLQSLIKNSVGKEILLDFEGSEIKGIARFYSGFGAKQENYFFSGFSRWHILGILLKRYLSV
jgi:hypothetical protein